MVLCLTARASAAEDLVIGMSADFKGKSRALGIELYRGAMAYFEGVNAEGGIHHRKIVIKAYNDNYEPAPAVDNTIELVEKDNVLLLFGYVGTPTTTRVLPLLKRYEKRDVLLFFPFTGAETVRRMPYEPFVYNLRASYQLETKDLVDFFVKVERKRVAVFYQVDAYGRTGWEGVRNALAKHNDAKFVGEATYRRGVGFDESMREQVDILRATNPDAVISIGAYGPCAAFIRDARDAGWNVPIANVSFVGSESMLRLLQKAGDKNGKDYTRFLLNSQVVPNYNDNLEAVREYREAMDKFDPLPPPEFRGTDYVKEKYSFVSLEGYLDAKVLTAILRKAKTPVERSGLRQAADSIKDLDLGIGKDVRITFLRKDDEHQGMRQVYFTVVRDGQFMTLRDEDWPEWRK
ncbi:ABC transporter substrate-binding protein [Planctomycetaceae bacterium SCGC AG-212-D15]|nr:ABC transporter substrate-binding protein [Planctomycetaceae bacterium SCGC AG-212-D15]